MTDREQNMIDLKRGLAELSKSVKEILALLEATLERK